MDTITITGANKQKINPRLLLDEIKATLGYDVTMHSKLTKGNLVEATLTRPGGEEFSPADQDKVAEAVTNHDPEQLSVRQEAAQAARVRRENAFANLAALGDSGIEALTEPSEVGSALADVVRALDLDRHKRKGDL